MIKLNKEQFELVKTFNYINNYLITKDDFIYMLAFIDGVTFTNFIRAGATKQQIKIIHNYSNSYFLKSILLKYSKKYKKMVKKWR